MELVLYRTYFPNGTNGEIYYEGERICYTIELPWRHNTVNISCIPEGTFILQKRYSPKHSWHLHLEVPGRTLILVHPANDALRELKGCIAPVSVLTDEGKGLESKKAFKALMDLVNSVPDEEIIYLKIQSEHYENS
jgi:hypothetical protein